MGADAAVEAPQDQWGCGMSNPHNRDMPDRIWAWLFVEEKRDDVTKGGWDDTADRKCVEYVRSDTQGWQDIATAPKDGTPIIGLYWNVDWADFSSKGRIEKCWYQPEFEAFISGCHETRMHIGHTFADGETSKLHSPCIENVSHWMPLPGAPS